MASRAFFALFFADLLPYSLAHIETITSCKVPHKIVGYLPSVNHNHAAAVSRGLDILKLETHHPVAVLVLYRLRREHS